MNEFNKTDKIPIIEIDEIKEYEFKIEGEVYKIRLDYNSLIKITEKTGRTFEELFYKVFIDNHGLYNFLLEILTMCCINKENIPVDYFVENIEPSAENIMFLEQVMIDLAQEVFEVETMNYINQKVQFKYLNTGIVEVDENDSK